ncbi:hypothetical protein [Verrucomicrobium sp. BvORR106]|uniref:hypothetical protein n=1 Tax=Verrucomicrobium sp. BvORR106 TaxID=1403819 RepID=UPI00224101C7|nr:hypothetical protein [Verrucomicrobium sp. BvORR106]
MLWHLSRAVHEGSTVVSVRGYLVYQTTWLGDLVQHTQDEIDYLVAAVGRVNQRWPGAFVAKADALPVQEDWATVIWEFDSRRLWPDRRGVWPFFEDVLAVALGSDVTDADGARLENLR